MTRYWNLLFILMFGLTLSACSDEDSATPLRTVTAQVPLTVLHALADAPDVNITADGALVLSALSFETGDTVSLEVGRHEIGVDARLPDERTSTVIGPESFTLTENSRYYAAAVGRVADQTQRLLLITQADTQAGAGEVQLSVGHLAADAPAVAIYVTTPTADLNTASPLAVLSFMGELGPVSLAAGDYRIRVTPLGSGTVVFDSGTLALAGGKEVFVGAVDNTGFGDAPISLVVVDDDRVTEVIDADARAGLKVAHVAAGAGNVDVAVNGAVVVANLAFPNVAPGAGIRMADYIELDPGQPTVGVRSAGNLTDRATANPQLAGGAGYTMLAANSAALELLLYEDDNRSVATGARLRVIHGAADAGEVDVYLTPQPAAVIGNTDPLLTDVPYQASSGYLDVAAGRYNVFVTVAGSGTVALGPVAVNLLAGGVYTLVAREASGGGVSVTILGDAGL
ncbi:DUF4397 domain-containing protein [Marinobacter sp. X15-166B]|uniref:DUF4397 domain-containing protein n=1 Tax=Marinobacter sp. X15-166B TaxID=1897620 RepID=UPI0013016D5A|nr:DUF4397 domain-containing protein [Marinobacter sp. X15-166B]